MTAEHYRSFCEKHKRWKEVESQADGDSGYYLCPDCEAGMPAYQERCSYCGAGINEGAGRYRAGRPGSICENCETNKLSACG